MTALLDLPGVTYTRSGAATAWRADGSLAEFAANVPRVTDAGIAIEGHRTNLFTRWDPTVAQFAAVANCSDATEPASPPLAGRKWITLNNTSSDAWARQTVTVSPSTQYTISTIVNSDDGSTPVHGTGIAGDFYFVLAGATISGVVSTRLSGNVWRFSATATTTASPTSNSGVFRASTQGKRPLKFSGFQLEQASAPSTHIITTGAAATRGADDLRLAKTIAAGEDFTVVVDGVHGPADGNAMAVLTLSDGTTNNQTYLRRSTTGSLSANTTVDGVATTTPGLAFTNGGPAKCAIRRQGKVLTLAVNGVIVGTDASTTAAPAFTSARIGALSSGGQPADVNARRTNLFPFAVSDAQLVSLTQ